MTQHAFTHVAKILVESAPRLGVVHGNQVFPLTATDRISSITDVLAAEDPVAAVLSLVRQTPIHLEDVSWLPPIDRQEVWAAGVTYRRSQTARMEESEAAASCYDRVYNAERPELFFKATSSRVVGHLGTLRIRVDATWNVPEPEVTLVLSPTMKIIGVTIGNDMSSRDIEGENPLYLPQAKCYNQCAGLGPWISLTNALPPRDQLGIHLQINREGTTVFEQSTSAAEMARQFDDLVGWLARDNDFPDGAFLMTGTGIIPDSDFTLHPGDDVQITIDGIGTLRNSIVQGET